MNRLCFITGIFLLLFLSSKGQLSVSNTSNAAALVSNIVGSGVQVTNVTLNCNGQASGTFSSSGTNLGLSSGIILATGNVQQASGSNGSNGDISLTPSSNPNCFNSSATFFDPNLSSIEPQANFDGCVLEFDIKPVCGLIEIKYVFASEEYPEYVGAGYNDAFGFFVWGPNPGGGSYVGTNIAQIPGQGIPVSIDNINGGNNSQFYVNNDGGATIQYDGFTTPLVASVNVSPCSNYHLKLAIADAGDCHYSSAVFLANGGVGCPNAQLPQITSSSTQVNCGNDGSAQVNVINSVGPITYNWQPGGQTTAVASNLGAGTYTCTVGFALPCPFTKTVSVNVTGNNALNVAVSSQNAYCNNPTGSAAAIVTGGILPYSTPSWNTVPAQNTLNIGSLLPGIYSITVSDASGCTITKPVTVANSSPTISGTAVIKKSTCTANNGSITISSIVGGTAPYSYSWNTIPVVTSQNLTNVVGGSYTLTITDADNCSSSSPYVVPRVDSILISILKINEFCDQRNGEIHVPVINGVAPYSWVWSHNATINDSIATNLSAGPYSFIVTDNTGCNSTGSAIITNIRDLFPGEIYTRPAEPIVDVDFVLGVTMPTDWNVTQILLADGSTRSNESEVTLNYSEYGYYNASFFVVSANGCLDTVEYSIFVKDFMTVYIPNAFSPNTDNRNNYWYVYGTLVKEISILIFDRWGEKIFESNSIDKGWDGTYKGKQCPIDTYIYRVIAKDYFYESKKFVGHIHLIR